MPEDATEIEPGLWCGGMPHTVPPEINCLVNLTEGNEASFQRPAGGWIYHLSAPVPDGEFRGVGWLETLVDTILRWRRLNLSVLVHCAAGISRSAMVTAAILMKKHGWHMEKALHEVKKKRPIVNPNPSFLEGLIIYEETLKLAPDKPFTTKHPDSLISLCIRVKHPVEQLLGMCLCLRRQRHQNWEAIVTTDGPNPDALKVVSNLDDPRFRVLETQEKNGFWGHGHRSEAIAITRGEWVGLTNDDNYYVPGYLDLMLEHAYKEEASLVLCDMMHDYVGWDIVPAMVKHSHCDVGSWLASGDMVRDTPWPGTDRGAGILFIEDLARRAGKVAFLHRPLFIHN